MVYDIKVLANKEINDGSGGYYQIYQAWDGDRKDAIVLPPEWNYGDPMYLVITKMVWGETGTHAIYRFQKWQRLGHDDAWLVEGAG